MEKKAPIPVEVAYALPETQVVLPLAVPEGTTVLQAIERSGILDRFPEIDMEKVAVGIFSRRVALDAPLSRNDRVEIYRPLKMDPREARRKLAAAQKKKTTKD